MPRATAVLVSLFLAAPLLAGCGSEQPGTGGSSGEDGPRSIEITFAHGSVTPDGERVEVEAGEPIELVVKSDEPGELHVHSTPEQELEYGAGTTTLQLTLDRPGVVDVESHHPEAVVVQLEVR